MEIIKNRENSREEISNEYLQENYLELLDLNFHIARLTKCKVQWAKLETHQNLSLGNFRTLGQRKGSQLFPERKERKDQALEWFRVYQQEPWDPEDNGENDFQTRILYPGKIWIKCEGRK